MGTKQGTKPPEASPSQAEKPFEPESLDLSYIQRVSILDGAPHQSHGDGNPLHSTAIEDDLRLPKVDAKAGGKKKKKGAGGLGKAPPAEVAIQIQRPGKDEGAEKGNKRGRTLANRTSSSSQTPGPSPKRALTRKSSSSRSADRQRKLARKSSSSDSGVEPPVIQTAGQRGRPQGRPEAQSSVVLDNFLAICHTYKESVESTAVRHAIDNFSSTVKERLTETITTSKELKVLKRDNAKVYALIKRKQRKLLDAKYELIRAKQQLRLLKKEEVDLGQRLADLRRGRSFLHGIRDLNARYLAHRLAYPTEKKQCESPCKESTSGWKPECKTKNKRRRL